MTKKKLMTAAAALALYETARDGGATEVRDAADQMAAVLRAQVEKAAAKPKKATEPQLLLDLRAALALAVKVVDSGHTIPVLQNVLLVSKEGTLTMSATDLDMELVVEIDAPGLTDWETTVNAKELERLLKRASGEVLLEAGDGNGKFLVIFGGGSTTLATIPAADFPIMSTRKMTKITMPAPVLADLLGFVDHAISTEETRYYLNGVYLHPVALNPPPRSPEHEAAVEEMGTVRAAFEKLDLKRIRREVMTDQEKDALATHQARLDELTKTWASAEAKRMKPDGIRAVATDGHRLASHEIAFPKPERFEPSILPRKSCRIAQMMLKGCDDDVPFEIAKQAEGGGFRLTVGNIVLTSKTIDGSYPDYARVYPRNNERRFAIKNEVLAKAVETVTTVCRDKTAAVRLEFSPTGIKLTARNMEGGLADAVVTGRVLPNAPLERFEIAFNSKYVREALKALMGSEVWFEGSDAASPALMFDPERPERRIVLMPLRF